MEEIITINKNSLDNIEKDICIIDTRLVLKNKEYYLKQATEMVAKYVNVVVTEDNLSDFKSTSTYLKAKAKSLNDARISAVEPYSTMLKELKADCDDIINIFSVCAEDISKQTKLFDEEEKERKRLEIKNLISDLLDESGIDDINKNQLIFDEKWLNKTKKVVEIRTEITSQLQAIFAKQELRKANIIARESLIAKLNIEYDLCFIADNFSIDRFSDEEVNNAYIKQHEANKRKLEEKLAQEKRKAELDAIRAEQEKEKSKITDIADNQIPKIIQSARDNPVLNVDNDISIQISINLSNPSEEMIESIKKIQSFILDRNIGTFNIISGKF